MGLIGPIDRSYRTDKIYQSYRSYESHKSYLFSRVKNMSHSKTELSEFEIKQLSRRFENAGIEEVLEWAAERFSRRLAMMPSFGAEGVVVIVLLGSVGPRTPIVYTAREFK